MAFGNDSLFADLFESAPQGFVVAKDGRVRLANAEAHRLLGCPPGTLIDHPLDDLLPERLDAAHGRPVTVDQSAPSTRRRVESYEFVARHRDGTETPIEIALSTMQVGCERLLCIAMRDVSARREALRKLRESEETFRLLVEGVRDYAIFFLDPTGHVVTWNAGAERIKGYRADEIIGQSFVRFYLPEDVAAGVPRRLLRRATEQGVATDEGVRLRKDGSRFWAYVVLTALHDDSGRLRGFAKVTRDISEQKHAAQERESLLQRLAVVLESCPVGILLFEGCEAENVKANRHAEKLIGAHIAEEQGLAQHRMRMYNADGTSVQLEKLPSYRALHGETVSAGEELLLRRDDGIDLPVLVSAAPLRDAAGQIDGAVVAFEEISAIKELERLRSEWASIVAHDLRQPLNAILMHAALLDSKEPDDKIRGRAQVIASSARRLNRMIRDLLDLSRLEANRLSIEHQWVDISELVRSAVDREAVLAPDRAIRLTLRADVGGVDGDPDRLDQILDNLLSNAVKYGALKTPIDIEVLRDDGAVEIDVTNHGAGLSPDQQQHLFERFTPGVNRSESVGLGLYIAKGLVEAHGGQMDVRSTPGDTTTFRVRLPRRAQPS